MKVTLLFLASLLLLLPCAFLAADTEQRIYTVPDPADGGGLRGRVGVVVTHALAVDHERVRVYRADMTDGGHAFLFPHLPTGKYDVVLVTKDGGVFEGLTLGGDSPPADLPAGSLAHLKERIEKQDAFFNRCVVQRAGFGEDNALAFVERVSDKEILRQDGTRLPSSLRRLEVIELARAADDWQVTISRHLYREEQPPGALPFLKHGFVPALGGLRVIDRVKDLGSISLPSL